MRDVEQPRSHGDRRDEDRDEVTESVAHHCEEAAGLRDRPRGAGVPRWLSLTQPCGGEEGCDRAQRRAGRVGEKVVDVEDPVCAGIKAPHAGELRRLDETGDRQSDEERRDDPATRERSYEEPERNEQSDIQNQLEHGGVGEGGARAGYGGGDVVEKCQRIEIRAAAGDRPRVRQRQESVGPDRAEIHEGGEPDDKPCSADATVDAVTRDHERDEEDDGEKDTDTDSDRGEQTVLHAGSLSIGGDASPCPVAAQEVFESRISAGASTIRYSRASRIACVRTKPSALRRFARSRK